MATSTKAAKTTSKDESQFQLLYGDDAYSKYWSSSLFNTVYLRHDVASKHACWNDEESLNFQNFLNELRNITADYRDRERELSSWSETETINNWVKRVLFALGWENNCTGKLNPYLEETTFRYDGRTYRTDILIVDMPNEKMYVKDAEGDKRIQAARESVLMPVEVKYWQRLEEYRQGKKEEKQRVDNGTDDISRIATPNEQTIQYMDVLKKGWGILTDGARWRLFNTELSAEDSERYYEFNLFSLFQAISTEQTDVDSREITEAAKYFFHFFSKFSFYPEIEGERPFVDEVLQYSKKYVNKVEEDLKDRFVKAMNIACNGIRKSAGKVGAARDLAAVRNVAESTLFNVLFIKSLESRGILPMASTDYKKISLSNIIDKIERFDPEKEDALNLRELGRAFRKGNGNSFEYDPSGDELHERIIKLTKVIHGGSSDKGSFGFQITGFKESVFSTEEWQIFDSCKISNSDWVKILFQLGYAESESLNRKYQQLPYAYFTARQLGSIYESFLEFKLDTADRDMVFEKRQWKPAALNSSRYKDADIPKVRKGDLFFTPDNEERKATGSYYTPDFVVRHMVKATLSGLVEKKEPEEILRIKVCDPAMGSGHFLSGALWFLTSAYLSSSQSEMQYSEAQSMVLHNCIFGVDLNPRALKLAKLSLWLQTANVSKKLEHLDDQLKCGNSLVREFDWKKNFASVFKAGGFDLVVGNPPYLDSENMTRSNQEELRNYIADNYVLAQGNWDVYIAFIEKGLSLLNENGSLSYITPDKWLSKPFGDQVRIQKIRNIRSITKAGRNVFPNAKVDSIITVFSNQDDKEIEAFTMDEHGATKLVSSTRNTALQTPYYLDEIFSENVSLLHKIESHGSTFSKLGKCESACATSDAYKIKPLVQDIPVHKYDSKKFYKMVNTGTIGKYLSKWGQVPMTYLKDKYSNPVVLKNSFSSEFPNSYGKKANLPKILIKGLTLLDACIDLNGEIVPGKSTLIVSSENNDNLKLSLGLLNSKLVFFYVKEKYKSASYNGGVVFTKDMINSMPIPEISNSKSKQIIEEVNAALKAAGISGPSREEKLSKHLEKIDKIIFEIYGMSSSDVECIQQKLSEKASSKKVPTKKSA